MNKKDFIYLLLFLFFILIFFRKIFFGMVPIPGNLLAHFFSPWKEEKWEKYPGGVYKQGTFGYDTVKMVYPWRSFTTKQLKKFQLPLWNPYQFSGAPHMGNFQTAVFYPLNLVYLILPQTTAWSLLFVLQIVFAGIFMYLYLRQLKISPLGAFFGSFSYAFSLLMSAWAVYNFIGHQFAYLPFILYLIEKYRAKKKKKFLFYIIGILVLTCLAGHPQIFLYIFVFCSLYFFYRLKSIKQWLLITLAVLGITAAAWLPLREYYSYASRGISSSEFNYQKTLLAWKNLITFISPDFLGNPTTANYWGKSDYTETAFYIGVAGFAFFLISIVSKLTKIKKFFIAAVLIVFFLCLNWFLPKLMVYLEIPVITSGVATRFLFLASFSVCVLAGFGVDDFIKNKKFPKILFALGIAFLLLFLFAFLAPKLFIHKDWLVYLPVMKRNLLLPFAVFLSVLFIAGLGIKFKKFKKTLIFFLLPVMCLDLFYVANKIIPFTYPEMVFASHPLIDFLQTDKQPYRFVGSKASSIESNFSTEYGIYSPEGYDALYPRYYGELVWSAESGELKDDISRTTVIFPVTGSNGQHRLENLLGIKYILEKDDNYENDWDPSLEKFPPENYQLVWQRNVWKVYENKNVYPRAFLADNCIVIKDKKEIINKFYDKEFNPRNTVILEEEIAEQFNPSENEAKAQIIDYQPNKVVIATKSNSDKLLFLSDTYYPGWRVYVDGNEKKIYKADYAFRAVVVPEGEHEVVFIYQPKSFQIGLFISIISLVFFISYIFYCKA